MKKILNRRITKKIIALVVIAAFVIIGIVGLILFKPYPIDDVVTAQLTGDALSDYENKCGIHVENSEDQLILIPDDADAGIIFFPGAKVQKESYYPLLQELAEDGCLCVALDFPLNMAIFDKNSADGITNDYPQIDEWYLAGHSLGGAVASMYLQDHTEEYDGLILLGSYSAIDYSEENQDIKVLSIYGSEDHVLNMERYIQSRKFVPDMQEYVIEGGCHALFGSYGPQDGDGVPSISPESQIHITADYIEEFIEMN